ncbi:basic proline-rich protein-like [Penaeus monodon]|uniref:basic proline-rich protein-like n=1 Tax=Penaeus monodon TaxID=6687 RepID=UPI0018A7D475|nr:basic proline-rich protein-like [Penaeus monodon]
MGTCARRGFDAAPCDFGWVYSPNNGCSPNVQPVGEDAQRNTGNTKRSLQMPEDPQKHQSPKNLKLPETQQNTPTTQQMPGSTAKTPRRKHQQKPGKAPNKALAKAPKPPKHKGEDPKTRKQNPDAGKSPPMQPQKPPNKAQKPNGKTLEPTILKDPAPGKAPEAPGTNQQQPRENPQQQHRGHKREAPKGPRKAPKQKFRASPSGAPRRGFGPFQGGGPTPENPQRGRGRWSPFKTYTLKGTSPEKRHRRLKFEEGPRGADIIAGARGAIVGGPCPFGGPVLVWGVAKFVAATGLQGKVPPGWRRGTTPTPPPTPPASQPPLFPKCRASHYSAAHPDPLYPKTSAPLRPLPRPRRATTSPGGVHAFGAPTLCLGAGHRGAPTTPGPPASALAPEAPRPGGNPSPRDPGGQRPPSWGAAFDGAAPPFVGKPPAKVDFATVGIAWGPSQAPGGPAAPGDREASRAPMATPKGGGPGLRK